MAQYKVKTVTENQLRVGHEATAGKEFVLICIGCKHEIDLLRLLLS